MRQDSRLREESGEKVSSVFVDTASASTLDASGWERRERKREAGQTEEMGNKRSGKESGEEREYVILVKHVLPDNTFEFNWDMPC